MKPITIYETECVATIGDDNRLNLTFTYHTYECTDDGEDYRTRMPIKYLYILFEKEDEDKVCRYHNGDKEEKHYFLFTRSKKRHNTAEQRIIRHIRRELQQKRKELLTQIKSLS